jgi:hypothetical protein
MACLFGIVHKQLRVSKAFQPRGAFGIALAAGNQVVVFTPTEIASEFVSSCCHNIEIEWCRRYRYALCRITTIDLSRLSWEDKQTSESIVSMFA